VAALPTRVRKMPAAALRSMPLSTGKVVDRPAAPDGPLSRGLCHSHGCARRAYNKGAMNGIDSVGGALEAPDAGAPDNPALIRYSEAQIPNYWQYARQFVLADHFFSSTFSNSFAGHFATTSGFNVALDDTTCDCTGTCTVAQYDPVTCVISDQPPCWDYPSVVLNLPTGLTWAEYGNSSLTLMSNQRVVAQAGHESHFGPFATLQTVLGTKTQPNLIFANVGGAVDEHPPKDICPGENNSVQLLNQIMNSPQWPETAVLLSWDDWGGFYDSVSPETPACATGDYMSPGFRVPLLVISPYAKQGFVLKTKTEQASVVRLIEDLWGLPRMHDEDPRIRDTTVGSLLEAFDFSQKPRPPFLLKTRACN